MRSRDVEHPGPHTCCYWKGGNGRRWRARGAVLRRQPKVALRQRLCSGCGHQKDPSVEQKVEQANFAVEESSGSEYDSTKDPAF